MTNNQEHFTMTVSQETIQSWASSSHISSELQKDLLKSNLLLVPSQGYIDRPDLLYFPSGTEDLITFLRERQSEGLHVDICIEDKEYRELALHADLLILAATVVSVTFAGAAADLFAEYVKRKLGYRTKDTNIKWDLTIQDDSTGKSIKLSFDGPASQYHDVISNAIKGLDSQQTLQQLGRPKQLLPTRRAKKRKRKRK